MLLRAMATDGPRWDCVLSRGTFDTQVRKLLLRERVDHSEPSDWQRPAPGGPRGILTRLLRAKTRRARRHDDGGGPDKEPRVHFRAAEVV
eukprot:2585556-Alexandrium_andersonii.AAC.1